MVAELRTETVYNVSPNLGGKMMKFEFECATTGDWVVFDYPIGATYAILPTGAQSTVAYAKVDTHADTVATTTQTTVRYDDGADATQVPETDGYIMIGTEIISYAAGGGATAGTFTGCSRGCFGTTAATHAENDDIYILNTLIFAASPVGLIRGIVDVIEE